MPADSFIDSSRVFSSSVAATSNEFHLESAACLINVCQEKDKCFADLKYKLKLQRLDQPTVSGLNECDYPSFESLGLQEISEFMPVRRHPLPQELTDQISRAVFNVLSFDCMECNCSMGVFNEVSRAWVVVDSDLFVWNYETNGDLAYFDGISNTILLLGLCRPKNNVLPPNIQFILCVVTSVDVVLLGVNFFDANGQQSIDFRFSEMNLMPEPLFKCSLDGSFVTDVCSTKAGRIFFTARDGCLYELEYFSRGLFGKSCKKVNHSKSLMSYLAPSLYTFTFGKDEPLIQLVFDDSRETLYTLSECGSLQMYDLGEDGTQLSKVASLSSSEIEYYASQIAQNVQSSHFKPVVHISPIALKESVTVVLLGITHSGVRLYFTCHQFDPQTIPTVQRPTTLKLVHIRFPPGFCPTNVVARPDKVHVGFIKEDVTLFASAYDDQSDVLWCLSNANFPFRPDFMETVAQIPIRGRTWVLSELKTSLLKGQSDWISTKFKGHVLPSAPMLAYQHREMPKRFVVFTPQGLHFMERLRPVDILNNLLVEYGPDSHQIRSFFQLHRPCQAGAMCILLACSTAHQHREVADRAVRALFLCGGEAKFFVSGVEFDDTNQVAPKPGPTTSTPFSSFRPTSQRIYPELPTSNVVSVGADLNLSTIYTEGRPVGSTEVKFSDRHNSLYLYFSRILGPLWQIQMIVERTVSYSTKKSTIVLDSAFTSEELTWFIEQLRNFLDFLKNESIVQAVPAVRVDIHADRGPTTANTTQRFLNFMRGDPIATPAQTQQQLFKKQQAEAMNIERQSLTRLQEVTERCYEVLGLWKVLTDHQMHVVVGLLPKDLQDHLKVMPFNELVKSGKEMCADLVACLMSQYLSDRATTDAISSRLRQVCPSLFTSDDATSAKANELLVTARTVDDVEERKAAMTKAMLMYKKVANQIHLPTVCAQLQEAENFDGIVDLCLCAAKKIDPGDVSLRYYQRQDPAGDEFTDQQKQIFSNRMGCYKCITDVLGHLMNVVTGRHPTIPPHQAQNWTDTIIKLVLASDDELCNVALFDWMFDRELSDRLLQSKSPFVEHYLQRRVTMAPMPLSLRYMDLLWKFYEGSSQFLPAAQLLVQLAENPTLNINLEQRVTYLSRALLCVKADVDASTAQAELFHDLEDKLEVVKLQKHVIDSLKQIVPTTNAIQEALVKLNSDLLDVTQLYNNYAEEFNLPECKLVILHCAGHYDPPLIDSLWRDIIDKEFALTSHESVEIREKLVESKILALGKMFSRSPRFFPINALIKYLFDKAVESHFRPSWLKTFIDSKLIKNID